MPDADPVMFELLQDAPALPALAEPRMGAIDTKWTRYKGTHKPCDLCTRRIHDLGTEKAPLPRPAREKRVGPNDTLLLCDVDAEEMKRKDADATTERQRRLDRAEELRKQHAGRRRK